MAKIERTLSGDFDELLRKIEHNIDKSGLSVSLEASSDFHAGNARCSVRVFERYSFLGGNRLSLTVTLFQSEQDVIHLSAITAGGSQAVFFKINTWGEESFLDDLRRIVDSQICKR